MVLARNPFVKGFERGLDTDGVLTLRVVEHHTNRFQPSISDGLHAGVLFCDVVAIGRGIAPFDLDRITELTSVAGLARYEVSAYARPGHRCQHNLNYWQFGDYLGIGAGAHSKLSFAHRILRQTRWREPAAYLRQAAEGAAVSNEQEVAREELPFEFMLNALRLREGFELARFAERTGLAVTAIQRGLEAAEAKGLIERDLQRVWPTERGFDFLSDLQSLFLP